MRETCETTAMKLITALILLVMQVEYLNSENIITTSSGKVQGYIKESVFGRPFLAFHGIPYGEPPIGNLRFAPPVQAKPWQGVLDGTKMAPFCKQGTHYTLDGGSEDCLTLEVFTPQVNESFLELYPVVMYIFGGKYIEGPVIRGHPYRFMDYNIILVSPNFRLGAFGYATTLDEVMPGNYGHLDQILALKWIHDNIAFFGGDATRVTLLGHSSGSQQATLDAISPLSQGLIHRAILMSGFILCKQYACNPGSKTALYSAQKMNCSTKTSQAILDCLRNATAEDILATYTGNGFGSVEGAYSGYMPLPRIEMPFQANIQKIPIMMGLLPNDGAAFTIATPNDGIESVTTTFEKNLKQSLCWSFNCSEMIQQIPAEFNVDIYANITDKEMEIIVQDVADNMYFASCCDESQKILSTAGFPIYAYKYKHSSKFKNPFGNRDYDHGVELPLLFSADKLTGADLQTSQEMLRYWTNFMAYGDPSPAHLNNHTVWEQWTANNPRYLLITENPSMQYGNFSNHTQFWDEQFQKILC